MKESENAINSIVVNDFSLRNQEQVDKKLGAFFASTCCRRNSIFRGYRSSKFLTGSPQTIHLYLCFGLDGISTVKYQISADTKPSYRIIIECLSNFNPECTSNLNIYPLILLTFLYFLYILSTVVRQQCLYDLHSQLSL